MSSQATSALDPTAHDAGFAGHRGLVLTRGEGCHVIDDAGRCYLDATSMYGVASLGHAHPALTTAIAEQAGTLISCFASYANDRRAELQARLVELLDPLDRIFLCNSGTESVEAAIKVARATTGRSGAVALIAGFHGRTMGALSATFRPRHKDAFGPHLAGFTHVRPGDLEALDAALTEDVGLVLVEVVQGEGGVRPLDGAYLRAVQALCRERGALFAVDEVQTGVGRTGRWFAYRHHGLDPDLVCLAKGLGGGVPIGALAFRASQVDLAAGSHGSTFGGNPLSAAAAIAVLDALAAEGLVERAADHGRRLVERLDTLLEGSSIVRAVRGLGLMIGIELTVASAPIQRRLQQRGFLVLGAGPRVLRLLPPLTITWDELEGLATAVAEEVCS